MGSTCYYDGSNELPRAGALPHPILPLGDEKDLSSSALPILPQSVSRGAVPDVTMTSTLRWTNSAAISAALKARMTHG